MVGMKSYGNALKSLWTGKCTVRTRITSTDEKTGRETDGEKVIFEEVPCRISFENVNVLSQTDAAYPKTQTITLFTGRETDIPPGSKITVTQNGITDDYEMSGVPAVYSTHRETPLALFRGWA